MSELLIDYINKLNKLNAVQTDDEFLSVMAEIDYDISTDILLQIMNRFSIVQKFKIICLLPKNISSKIVSGNQFIDGTASGSKDDTYRYLYEICSTKCSWSALLILIGVDSQLINNGYFHFTRENMFEFIDVDIKKGNNYDHTLKYIFHRLNIWHINDVLNINPAIADAFLAAIEKAEKSHGIIGKYLAKKTSV